MKQEVLIRLKEKPFPQEDSLALENAAEKLHSKIKPSAILSACTADPACRKNLDQRFSDTPPKLNHSINWVESFLNLLYLILFLHGFSFCAIIPTFSKGNSVYCSSLSCHILIKPLPPLQGKGFSHSIYTNVICESETDYY